MRPRFWEKVALGDMTPEEWEALCDGCGKCCLLKLEDEDTGRTWYTDVHCRLFDPVTRRCGNYAIRRKLVPGCVVLTPDSMDAIAHWMPTSCAYRRLHEGRGLAAWHPLISGRRESVSEAGISVACDLVPEWEVADDDLEEHLLAFDEAGVED